MITKQTKSGDTQERRQAERFGALVRERREALKMRQDDLALATNVGRRFIIDLEVVAAAVGVRPFDLISEANFDDNALLPDLPDMKDNQGA